VIHDSAVRHDDANIEVPTDEETRPVYLDCCATTPLTPAVLEEVHRYLAIEYGNEGSRTHSYGAVARKRVNLAREEVAALAAASPDEVFFTSGATEANNLAILGLAPALAEQRKCHVVTSALEHKGVLEPMVRLEAEGFDVSRIASDSSGVVDPEQVLAAIRPETGLVSLMHVNNETGVLQRLGDLADQLPDQAFFHVDAAQGLGKEVEEISHPRIDLISGSAHKLHGPKGVGVLIARRRGYRRLPLSPLMVGGGQERGIRPGTVPVHLVAGFGAAASTAVAERSERDRTNREFRARALKALSPLQPLVNGDPSRTLSHVLNVSFPGVDAEAAILASKDLVAISSGSACTSSRFERSHVLTAMGLIGARLDGALRFSWCHLTPEPDWDDFVERIAALKAKPAPG
jgi:cysteine desulfurase